MRDHALVLGTSNKSELLLGYGTLHGDIACALNPLGDLYKTQVRSLARHVGVPDRVLSKAPTADLWVGQTDEDELGFAYEQVDLVLYLLFDRHLDPVQVAAYGFDRAFVDEVVERVRSMAFKRRLPPIAKLPAPTIAAGGRDGRDPGS
jgi:NAD+ synthase